MKTKILSLENQGTGEKTNPAVPPKLILKRIRLCLVPSYKSALITGADHPLTATHHNGFRSPSEVHSQTTRISPFSKRRLSARRIERYLLFIIGLIYCLHHKPQAAFCQALYFVKTKNLLPRKGGSLQKYHLSRPNATKNFLRSKILYD